MKKPIALTLIGCAMMAMVLTSCSSKPSDQELKQLNDLKAEITSLQNQISSMQSQKAALEKSIADKDAQIAQLTKDKNAVQQRLKPQ